MSKTHPYSPPEESPIAEAATVAWLVSVMMATLLDVLAAGLHIYIVFAGLTQQRALFANYSLYTAATTGLVSLLLAVATFRLRVEKPPPKVTTFSVIVTVAPILVVFLMAFR